MTQTATQLPYSGRWKTVRKDFGIKLGINWVGDRVSTIYSTSPYKALFIDNNGNAVLSLIANFNETRNKPLQFEIMNMTGETWVDSTHGYFNMGKLKEWLDERNILNRPHYREAGRQVKDFYKRVVAASDRVRKLNKRLKNMSRNPSRAELFEGIVGDKQYFDDELLKADIELFESKL